MSQRGGSNKKKNVLNAKRKNRPTWAGFKPLIGPTKKTLLLRAERKHKKRIKQNES